MADYILLFKNTTKAIALSNGVGVTFMPKPFPKAAGNGMHCHLQLWDGEKNLFGEGESSELSKTAKSFIAGILEHAPAITAIANPTINSYKRLVPHYEAPVYVSWGPMNRTALIRVPLFVEGRKAAIEFRSADAMSNPYLLFTSLLAAGMDGINRDLAPTEARTEDIFHMSDEERESYGITTLPPNLAVALDCLENDKVIRDAIGEGVAKTFLKIKRNEWREYINFAITDWEWQTYSDN
jgi:glutamine synthetase